MLMVGSTGIGKSSFLMQSAILWALGKEAFGITPARPLRLLIVQAENDDDDLFEEMDGVRQGLNLTDEEWNRADQNIRIAREDTRTGVRFFQSVLRPLLDDWKPDLFFIDPAFSFLDGEASTQGDVTAFLRTHLNPLIREFNCGVIVNHHTNKPVTGKEAKGGGWTDMQKVYAASGSAEWANWARAALLIEEIPGLVGAFNLIAPKRGARLRWRSEEGGNAHLQKANKALETGRRYLLVRDEQRGTSHCPRGKPGGGG